ncbi:hypothetical protein BJF79_06475 [Actinomadura sp. CNU-125]|uniref:hypothetical protein n=1 Tax=Actinomadura sp. CNU-125 TaxID=1904961 RepID=UPI00095C8C7D|nr:hypothetical protein [Actinomadura sp. CNU-125]OLT36262.1 hypothetical protein BJF79_06475 [Actinomadura sp. CNU-125]
MAHYWEDEGDDIERKIRSIGGVVHDYPYDDPFQVIEGLAADAETAAKSIDEWDPSLPVLGLVATVPYLCFRSQSRRLVRDVRTSLEAVAAKLGEPPCPHGDAAHPFGSEYSSEDVLYAMEDLAEEAGRSAEAELWSCPRNLSGLASKSVVLMDELLAEDGEIARAEEGIYSPELKDTPDVFLDFTHHHHNALFTDYRRGRAIRPKWLLRSLFEVVRREPPFDDDPDNDHRGYLLWCARRLRARPDGPESAGLVLALSDAYTYSMSDDVLERAVRDELVEAFSEAHRVRRDATCAHAGEHPALDPEETLVAAAKLWDPDYTDAEVEARPVSAETAEAVSCPARLRELAFRAADELRRDVAGRFGPRADADLDALFLDEDGALRIDRVARDVRFHNAGPTPESSPAVWCARRLTAGAADDRERAALALSVVHAARHPHWYAGLPGAADVFAEALAAVVAAAPPECGHTGGHTVGDAGIYSASEFAQLIPAVHGFPRFRVPVEHPEDRAFLGPTVNGQIGPGPERWRCPVHLAALARRALAEASG